MAAAAAGGQVVGAGLSAFGSLVQGQQTANSLEYSATVQRQNAAQAIIAGKINAERQQIMAAKTMGSISAGYGASGVDASSGSVLAVLGASAANAEFDRQNILHGAEVRAINYENQASMDDVAGEHAITASYFNAVAGIFGGAARIGADNISAGSKNLVGDIA